MTEQELIRKIQTLKSINPDTNWADLNYNGLINGWASQEVSGEEHGGLSAGIFGQLVAVFNFNRMVPARVAIPSILMFVFILSGMVYNNYSYTQSLLNSGTVVIVVNHNNDKNALPAQQNNALEQSDSGEVFPPSDSKKIAVKNPAKKNNSSIPLASGLQNFIEKVRTVTIGGGEDDNDFEADLQTQTKEKIENLKKQVENLLMGDENDIALAESVMPVLKEAEELLAQNDLVGAFEKAVAVEKTLNR